MPRRPQRAGNMRAVFGGVPTVRGVLFEDAQGVVEPRAQVVRADVVQVQHGVVVGDMRADATVAVDFPKDELQPVAVGAADAVVARGEVGAVVLADEADGELVRVRPARQFALERGDVCGWGEVKGGGHGCSSRFAAGDGRKYATAARWYAPRRGVSGRDRG